MVVGTSRVWETAERQVCQTVMKPVRETVYRTESSGDHLPAGDHLQDGI